MGFSRISVATTTAVVAAVHLVGHSISSAEAFHIIPPGPRPGRHIRTMTARPSVMNHRHQTNIVSYRRPLCRTVAVGPVGGAEVLSIRCFHSSASASRPPPSVTYRSCSTFSGGWSSASSVRRTERRGRRERPGGALFMVTSGGGKEESTRDKALATVVYLLPILDGIDFGENLFRVCPQLGALLHVILGPALGVWENVPFMPLVMFVILQVSVRRQDTSRFVRFNVQQAILVDILTVVLGLLGTAVGYLIPEGEQFMTNFAFYCLAGAVAYAVTETARGRVANQIPLISAAAEVAAACAVMLLSTTVVVASVFTGIAMFPPPSGNVIDPWKSGRCSSDRK